MALITAPWYVLYCLHPNPEASSPSAKKNQSTRLYMLLTFLMGTKSNITKTLITCLLSGYDVFALMEIYCDANELIRMYHYECILVTP